MNTFTYLTTRYSLLIKENISCGWKWKPEISPAQVSSEPRGSEVKLSQGAWAAAKAPEDCLSSPSYSRDAQEPGIQESGLRCAWHRAPCLG